MKILMNVFVIALVLLTSLTSCHKLEETGEHIVHSPKIDQFSKIEVESKARINILHGEPAVTLEGDAGIIDALDTYVDDGTLKIELDRNYQIINIEEYLTIDIYVMDFDYLKVKGENIITFQNNYDLESLEMDLDGDNVLTANGTVDDWDMRLRGESTIHGFNFESLNTKINIQGESEVETTCQEDLHVRIYGEGTVYYKGQPTIDKRIFGEGQVIDAN